MLGLMSGDALGASVEGWPQSEIRSLSQLKWGTDLVQGFIPAVHMGTYVPAGEPGQYRPAQEVRDSNFVPTGPPQNANTGQHCARSGMYTDDTNTCLALASSIVDVGGVDAAHAARRYADFWRSGDAVRGYPPSAKGVMQHTLDGKGVETTGLPPLFPFPGGSFANGGGMRISPLSIAYRNADQPSLRVAVQAAILGSHRHPEAIDFAVVQAAAVQKALLAPGGADGFDVQALLAELPGHCETEAMRGAIASTAAALAEFQDGEDELAAVQAVVERERRPGSGMGFQIASIHMMPCVLWAVCRHYREPRLAVQTAIDLGGDTDTTASMVGAVVGALHGEAWCQDWAAELENGERGRDYALGLAERLLRLSQSGPAAPIFPST